MPRGRVRSRGHRTGRRRKAPSSPPISWSARRRTDLRSRARAVRPRRRAGQFRRRDRPWLARRSGFRILGADLRGQCTGAVFSHAAARQSPAWPRRAGIDRQYSSRSMLTAGCRRSRSTLRQRRRWPALTKNAAHAHRFDRIRVNAINVGWVDTPAERQMQAVTLGKGEGWLAEAAAQQPFRAPADPGRRRAAGAVPSRRRFGADDRRADRLGAAVFGGLG